MQRKTTREILIESFKELAVNKDVEKITIKEITDNCGYSPATFYRQFKDKYDLIAWDYSEQVRSNMSKLGIDGHTWKQALLTSARYSLDHKNYLLNLFKHTSGIYSFEQYMTDINVRFIVEYLRKNSVPVDESLERVLRVYCYGTVRITLDRLLGKYEADSEELVKTYEMSMPECLSKIQNFVQ